MSLVDVDLDVVDDVAVFELTMAYIDQLSMVAEWIGQQVRAAFLDLDSWNRADIEAFIRETQPLIEAGRAEAIDLATGYIGEVAGVVPGMSRLTLPAPKFDEPFLAHWHELKERQPFESARDRGAAQAEALGYDEVRNAGATRMGSATGVKTIVGWNRVITLNACEWCQVVATQRYHTQESATFGHHHCRCQIMPIFAGREAGVKAINSQRLQALRASGATDRVSVARERSKARERAERAALLA